MRERLLWPYRTARCVRCTTMHRLRGPANSWRQSGCDITALHAAPTPETVDMQKPVMMRAKSPTSRAQREAMSSSSGLFVSSSSLISADRLRPAVANSRAIRSRVTPATRGRHSSVHPSLARGIAF